MNVATQARRKHFDRNCPPVRVKHFISCSYRDLDFLVTHLDGITTETYTPQLAKKTEDHGDWCMMCIVEWGHARLEYEDDITMFDDQDHMDYIGEFTFRVSEPCLSSDHNIFMVAPTDKDAHNPILVHLETLRHALGWKTQVYSLRGETKTQGEEKGNTKGEQEERFWWWEHLARLERLASAWLWWILSFIVQNMETEVSVYFSRWR